MRLPLKITIQVKKAVEGKITEIYRGDECGGVEIHLGFVWIGCNTQEKRKR